MEKEERKEVYGNYKINYVIKDKTKYFLNVKNKNCIYSLSMQLVVCYLCLLYIKIIT